MSQAGGSTPVLTLHGAMAGHDQSELLAQTVVLFSTCGTSVDTPIPWWSFRLMTALSRWPAAVDWLRSRALRDPEAAATRSILDPAVRARTFADAETTALMQALTASTFDRMSERLPGTGNDIRVTRRLELPLEKVKAPVLIVHGTADRMVPFDPHATTLANRIAGAELLPLQGGEPVAIFTHRAEVRARVEAFLAMH